MAWSTPRDWVAGELVTVAHMNQEVRDNLKAIVPVGPDAWTAFTPTLTQPGAIAKTVNRARYTKVGRLVVVTYDLAVTAAGTAGNDVLVGLPLTAASALGHGGVMMIYDASTTTRYNGGAEIRSTTTFGLSYNQASANIWGTTPNLALASGDIIRAAISYEAAA